MDQPGNRVDQKINEIRDPIPVEARPVVFLVSRKRDEGLYFCHEGKAFFGRKDRVPELRRRITAPTQMARAVPKPATSRCSGSGSRKERADTLTITKPMMT